MAENYINEDKAKEINERSNVVEIIQENVILKNRGSSLKGDCPMCGGKGKLSVNSTKKLFKCFGCDLSGKSAAQYLMATKEMTYPEALATLAERYGIDTHVEQPKKEKGRPKGKGTFRDLQLTSSGLTNKDQVLLAWKGPDTDEEVDRYTSASVNGQFNEIDGDDMVLHYYGLNRKPLTFEDEKTKKSKDYKRVRWQFPSAHKNKMGKDMKYQSPYGSTSQLWLPNKMIGMVNNGATFETLYICEGEKKADKLMKHDIPAVAISGIHNFNVHGQMVAIFEVILKNCGVRKVVFLLDADWRDISVTPTEAADYRPKTFASAVEKFKTYFIGYAKESIFIEIFFGYHRDTSQKGVDDLLVKRFPGNEKAFREDLEGAVLDREGKGTHVQLHKVTAMNHHKIKEFWGLHDKEKFFEMHSEILKEVRAFKFNNILHRYNEEEDTFELDQKIMPEEQFWEVLSRDQETGDPTKIAFDYININRFLNHRGFGKFQTHDYDFTFIHENGKVIHEVPATYIKDFVINFSKELKNRMVLSMLYRGAKQYLGEYNLGNMDYLETNFLKPEANVQYFFFKETYWKITPENIESRPLSELPFHIWKDQIIDAAPKILEKGVIDIREINDRPTVQFTKDGAKSDLLKFLVNTSNFHWEKTQKLVVEGLKKKYVRLNPDQYEITDEERTDMNTHVLAKILAAGSVLRKYRHKAQMKAIFCLDGVENESGRSDGGTGKSIWSTMFEHLLPTVVIDAKSPNLTNDSFIYDEVDLKTACIVFDDCRMNIDIEFFFSQTTRGITVNRKGERKFKRDPLPFIFNMNAIPRGDGASFDRRRYNLAFSNYYNVHRTPADDFGRQLFDDWDWEQWNLFYNLMAQSVQAFMKYGFTIETPQENVLTRKMRQDLGEDFLDWAELFFDKEGRHLNNAVESEYAFDQFMRGNQNQSRFMNKRLFKKKIKIYCQYANYDYNPQQKLQKDERIRHQGKDYITIADGDFSTLNCQFIP